MTNEMRAIKVGEFWVNRHSGVRVLVRELVTSADGALVGVLLDDVHEGATIDLGFRYPAGFVERYERMHTEDEAHNEALAENVRFGNERILEAARQRAVNEAHDEALALLESERRSLPTVGTFYKARMTDRRAEVMSASDGRVRIAPRDTGAAPVWLSLAELERWYVSIGTVDEAHAAALAEMGAQTCDECKGMGTEPELIDAPDYQGPALCQACGGRGWWALGGPERVAFVPNPDDEDAMNKLYAALGAGDDSFTAKLARAYIHATVRHLYVHGTN